MQKTSVAELYEKLSLVFSSVEDDAFPRTCRQSSTLVPTQQRAMIRGRSDASQTANVDVSCKEWLFQSIGSARASIRSTLPS
jgi:hypothetical protein